MRPGGRGRKQRPARKRSVARSDSRCSTREAATKLPMFCRGLGQMRQMVLFTLRILAERVRFELTGLSSSGFQVWVMAFAGVRGRPIHEGIGFLTGLESAGVRLCCYRLLLPARGPSHEFARRSPITRPGRSRGRRCGRRVKDIDDENHQYRRARRDAGSSRGRRSGSANHLAGESSPLPAGPPRRAGHPLLPAQLSGAGSEPLFSARTPGSSRLGSPPCPGRSLRGLGHWTGGSTRSSHP